MPFKHDNYYNFFSSLEDNANIVMRMLVHEVVVCFNALCAKYKNNNEKMVHSLIECRKGISLYGKPCKQANKHWSTIF